MKSTYIVILVSIVGILSSCVKNNPDPSWIEISDWTLEANPNSEFPTGELTENITDAWVYIDNEIVGVFELPIKLPILKKGAVQVKIYPAIKNNGIAATKKIYPFMEAYTENVTLIQNATTAIAPKTKYKNNVKFFIEDFEDASPKLITDPNSAAQFVYGNDPSYMESFNGNFVAEIQLNNSTDTTWIAYTDFASIGGANLPRGAEVYLEIDFYTTNNLVTGLLAISPAGIQNNQNIQLNGQTPSTVQWRKIYIDLRELISNSNVQAYFEHTFQAVIDEGESTGTIILDNIKVVHF